MEQYEDPFKGLGAALEKGWARGRALAGFLRTIDQLILGLASVVSLPAELVLHRRFGERHFSLFKVVLAAALPAGPIGLAGVQAPAFYQIAILMPFIIIGGSLAHWIFAVQRRKAGVRWHSRCDGIPHFLNLERCSQRSLYITLQYVEPGILLFVGLVISLVTAPIGMYIQLIGTALALKVYLQVRQDTGRLLDAIDSQIESENLTSAIDGRSPAQTDGFYIHGSGSFTPDQKLTLANAYGALSDDLKDLISVRPTRVSSGEPQEREPTAHDEDGTVGV